MQIHGSRTVDRSQWGSTYDSANRVGSHPADAALASRGSAAPDATRDTAVSALRNERFGSMLEKISDPRASDALMRMGRDGGVVNGTDQGSAFAAYGEDS